MYTIRTKANCLMSASFFDLEPRDIVCNDVILPSEFDHASRYNRHNVSMWLIGNEYGAVCAIFASHEKDALDSACNIGMMEEFLIHKDSTTGLYDKDGTTLGNDGKLHDLDHCWVAEADLQAERDIKLIVKLARADEAGHDHLDF
jgi:hypothetical protein